MFFDLHKIDKPIVKGKSLKKLIKKTFPSLPIQTECF